jgi:hypothetical protein
VFGFKFPFQQKEHKMLDLKQKRLIPQYYGNSSQAKISRKITFRTSHKLGYAATIRFHEFVYLVEALIKVFGHITCHGEFTIQMKWGMFMVEGSLMSFDDFNFKQAKIQIARLFSCLEKFKEDIKGQYEATFTTKIKFKGVKFKGETKLIPYSELRIKE